MISQLQKITAITCLVLLVAASISVAEDAPANRRGGQGFRGGRGSSQGGNGQGNGYRGGRGSQQPGGGMIGGGRGGYGGMGGGMMGGGMGGMHDCVNDGEFIEIEADLVNTAVLPDAKGEAEWNMNTDRVEFSVEIENVSVGSYALKVGGIEEAVAKGAEMAKKEAA